MSAYERQMRVYVQETDMLLERVKGHQSRWRMEVETLTDNLQEELACIPGLIASKEFPSWEGATDAVAAALQKLGYLPYVGDKLGFPPYALTYPSGQETRLRQYQKDGVSQLHATLRAVGGAFLCDDMGLGKTAQAIALGQQFKGRKLVVCPASVRETWRDDFAKWGVAATDAHPPIAILGPPSERRYREDWEKATDATWVVTSYELLERAFEQAFTDVGSAPRFLVIDELHLVKGRKNYRSKTLENVARYVPFKLGMTGTPIWDRPRDWWKQLHILLGTRFGNQYDFDRRYCDAQPGAHGGLENKGASNTDELRLRLSYYMVRREKKDVLTELPVLSRQVIWVDPDATARRRFEGFASGAKGHGISAAIESTLKGKMAAVCELAQEARRFVLFTYLRAHAHQLAEMLARDYETPCGVITGDMPHAQRQDVAKQCAAMGHGLVATIDSAGTGMDVLKHVASIGIFHSIDYVPQKMAQAEGRLHRMGQTQPVHWYYVAMRDSIDTYLVRTVVEKMDMVADVMGKAAILDGMKENLTGEDAAAAEADALQALYESMKEGG